MVNNSRRYVIVGTGVAGISAAEAIRQADPTARIDIVGDDPHGYYSRPGLAYYLTGEVTEAQLFPFGGQTFRQLSLHHWKTRATFIDHQAHHVVLADGTLLPYHRLLLATGSQAVTLKSKGSELSGVVKLDHLEDARQIIQLAKKSRRAVIVGGGITALELAEGLTARGVKIHYFLRGDRYWGNVLDETESKIIEHRLQEEGVTIHYHTEVEEVLADRGRVAAVLTTDSRRIPCDLVAVAIGVKPNIKLAQASGTNTDRGIVVDELLQTSQADVFAAGDVAQLVDPLTGESTLNTLWDPARRQGTCAGKNMAGITSPYRQAPPLNVTRLATLTTTIIGRVGSGVDRDLLGIARGDSEIWRRLPDAITAQADFDVNRLRLLVGERCLIGAIVMGDQNLSQPLHRLVSNEVDITPIRGQLLQPGAPIAEIIASFYADYRSRNEICSAGIASSGLR